MRDILISATIRLLAVSNAPDYSAEIWLLLAVVLIGIGCLVYGIVILRSWANLARAKAESMREYAATWHQSLKECLSALAESSQRQAEAFHNISLSLSATSEVEKQYNKLSDLERQGSEVKLELQRIRDECERMASEFKRLEVEVRDKNSERVPSSRGGSNATRSDGSSSQSHDSASVKSSFLDEVCKAYNANGGKEAALDGVRDEGSFYEFKDDAADDILYKNDAGPYWVVDLNVAPGKSVDIALYIIRSNSNTAVGTLDTNRIERVFELEGGSDLYSSFKVQEPAYLRRLGSRDKLKVWKRGRIEVVRASPGGGA